MIRKIISGGQTGVDQGALDFALGNGMDCGGWCPPGRECETGRIPQRYPLREVEVNNYNERTRRNIVDADATLVITAGGRMEEGTRLTLEWAKEYGRPYYHLDLPGSLVTAELPVEEAEGALLGLGEPVVNSLRDWLEDTRPSVLNLAGNRESTSPGIQQITRVLLSTLLGPVCAGGR